MLPRTTKNDIGTMLGGLSSAYARCIRHISEESGITPNEYLLENNKPCYGFIPYGDYTKIVEILTALRKKYYSKNARASRPKFLDIGCGIGNIVLLAHSAGYSANGLEYDPKTYKVAKSICKPTGSKIFKGDMNKFRRYGEYDVLYYYKPMSNNDDMHKFACKLIRKMKPGAHVIAIGPSNAFLESTEFSNVGMSCVWRKENNND